MVNDHGFINYSDRRLFAGDTFAGYNVYNILNVHYKKAK